MEFAGLQNVLAIPHIAANTHESHKKLGNEVISNFKAIIAGTPVHIIA
jgi:phosphoglycerate dehydrogenase-like enzyme